VEVRARLCVLVSIKKLAQGTAAFRRQRNAFLLSLKIFSGI